MDLLQYWDAFTFVGPHEYKHPATPWSLEHLEKAMEHCAISGAMVLSTQSVYYDPWSQNLKLSQQITDTPRLRAIWNVIPSIGNEFPSPSDLIREMRVHNVRAVSLFPITNGWDILDPFHDTLFTTLSEHHIPIYLPRAEFADYAILRTFLEHWQELLLIIPNVNWTEQRTIIPLLQRHSQLHITTSHFQAHYGPEDFATMGLENQLLYGSNAPTMSMGAHRCYIDYAEISDVAKQKIAGGNLSRLLREPLPSQAPAPVDDDILMQTARNGKSLPIPLIDMHMHILEEGMQGGGGSYRMSQGGPRGVLHLLERLGCVGGGFMSWNGTVSCDTLAGNICTQHALDAAPAGFWGLGSFDPCHYSQVQLKQQILQLYQDKRFIGMKPYVRQGVSYDSPLYDSWWQFGNEQGLYALLHRTHSDFSEVLHLARKYPNIQWIVAHCGASFAVADQTIEAIQQHSNIYAEITYTPVGQGVIEYLVAGCGADRVLYGSDLPMRDPRQQLGWVVHSHLTLEEKKQILSKNAFRLIKKINPDLLPSIRRTLVSED